MKKCKIKLSFKARWELYRLHIKIGDPHIGRFRLAIKLLPTLFKPSSLVVLFG